MLVFTLILTVIVYVSFFLLSPILSAVSVASQWVVDGDVLNIAKRNETSFAVTPHALAPSLTFNGNIPYITWTEISSKGISLVYVKHKDVNEWIEDGGPLNISQVRHAASPALTSVGNKLYVAWSEMDLKNVAQIYVKEWNGKEWVQRGESININPSNQATNPVLSGDSQFLYVAWTELSSTGISWLYVKQWDGNSWRHHGKTPLNQGLINANENSPPPTPHPALPHKGGGEKEGIIRALPQGEGRYEGLPIIPPPLPVLSSELAEPVEGTGGGEGEGDRRVFSNESMNKSPERHALTPSLASDKDGVYLAWTEYDKDGISQVFVSRWNGERWEAMGKSINIDLARHALSPSLSISKSTPYVSWMEYNEDGISQVYVKRWNGKEWVRVGGSINIDQTRHASSPSLSLKDGVPYAAWVEIGDNGFPNIYVKHWEKDSWIQDGGYVNEALDRVVTAPATSIKDKTVYVAFSETDTGGIYRLYIKRLMEGKGETPSLPSGDLRKSLPRKEGTSRTFFTSMPKDTKLPEDLPPPLAFKYLSRTHLDEIDWMGGIRNGILKPFDSIDPDARPPLPPIDLNIILPVKKEFGIPEVTFPHLSHTMWLDCRNCHPTIFVPKRGGNPITMHRVIEGEYCGRCHGVVAFRLFDCFRCHSKD